MTMEQLHFLTPEEVRAWLEGSAEAWSQQFELGSVSLLEHLVNDIQTDSDPNFATYQAQSFTFLARLEAELKNPGSPIHHKLASVYGVLMSFLAEAGPYRFETKRTPDNPKIVKLLDDYRAIRLRTREVGHLFFQHRVFDPIRQAVDAEIRPILESACELSIDNQDDRYQPFRVLAACAITEQLRFLNVRLQGSEHTALIQLLKDIYHLKYLRFGTSGYRGVWDRDFTEEIVRVVSQAICDFLKLQNMPKYASGLGENLSGRIIVIGYDGRRGSERVGRMVAETCLANGFDVHFASRPSPTPALNFYAREKIGRDHVAGLINCTASHNPPEWQGIKFNPKEGYPAPTALTDVIGSRATVRQLLHITSPRYSTEVAEAEGRFQQFDPKNLYLDWVRAAGKNNRRIALNFDQIWEYFKNKRVIIDPMYGAGREYLSTILGELGIPHEALHDERDEDLGWQTEAVRGVPHLEYANPEMPFIQPLIDKVVERKAALGLGLDTDADRFGFVDRGGVYIRPNQILAMLTRYLGVERGETGRVIITQTGLPMIDAIAQSIPGNEANHPPKGTIPAYISHPFYHRRIGAEQSVTFSNTYVVPVGIKYIVDVARVPENVTDPKKAYGAQSDADLPATWMDRMLIGGEESSGLTTRGHVPDKDGVWAGLLVMDMIAHYGLKSGKGETSLVDIWEETTAMDVAWKTYGSRVDVDASIGPKEQFLNYFLDELPRAGTKLAGLDIYYLGGTRYDMVEIFLEDARYGKRHYMRVRASGTEPIARIYVESADKDMVGKLLDFALSRLDAINTKEIEGAYSVDYLADLLANTRFTGQTLAAAQQLLAKTGWNPVQLCTLLKKYRPHVESRNAKLIDQWLAALNVPC